VLVFNKLDALPAEKTPALLQDTYEVDGIAVPRVFVSAHSGAGLPQLRQMLADAALAARQTPKGMYGGDGEEDAPEDPMSAEDYDD